MSTRDELDQAIHAALADGDLKAVEDLRAAAEDAGQAEDFETAYGGAWRRHQDENEPSEEDRMAAARRLVAAENTTAEEAMRQLEEGGG
jgi:hypothetical protein